MYIFSCMLSSSGLANFTKVHVPNGSIKLHLIFKSLVIILIFNQLQMLSLNKALTTQIEGK